MHTSLVFLYFSLEIHEASFKCSQAEAKSKTQGTKTPVTVWQETKTRKKKK